MLTALRQARPLPLARQRKGQRRGEGELGGEDWVLLTLLLRIPIQRQMRGSARRQRRGRVSVLGTLVLLALLTLLTLLQRQVRQRKEAEAREGELRASIKPLMQDLEEFLASNTSDAPPPTSFTTVCCSICVLIL